MKKIIALVLFSLSGTSALACSVTSTSYVNLAISTVEEKIFSYNSKNIDEKLPNSVISNCRDTAAKRRFVMITFGPEVIGKIDSTRGTNFDRSFTADSCTISNNPLKKIQTEKNVQDEFEAKWKFINECVEMTVVEVGPKPLSYPTDQVGCKITQLSSQSAVFNGGFCFFKPSAESFYNVSVGVKDSCKKLSGYKQYGVDLQDFEAGINYYTSSAYKDEVNDLSAFGSSNVRLSVNPSDLLFKPSDDFGILRPTFPGDYPINDVHLGKIEIDNQGPDWVVVKTPLIVNNFCNSIEKNGLKSSICNYATPYVGEIKLINSKGQVQDTWYDGGVAPSQWQGILSGEGRRINKDQFKPNSTYKIEVSFSDPYFEFGNFKKTIKSRIKGLKIFFPSIVGGDGISEIPEIGVVDKIDEMMDVGAIGDVTFPAQIDDLGAQRKKLGAYFSTTMFPPMYSKACHPETGICENIGKEFVKLTATFKVDSDYTISDLEVERNSKILGSYKKKIEEQPEYICN